MSAGQKIDTYGRGLYASVLLFLSLLSVAGNAVYAYAAPPQSETSLSPGWAAAAHMIPPVLLLLVTEVLATATAKFSGRGRAWALAGVVAIAVAAFTLSFDALYEVAQMAKVRHQLAWLVPVMLDAAIVVCTLLVLMASRQMQADRAAASGVTVPSRVEAPVDRPAVEVFDEQRSANTPAAFNGHRSPSVAYPSPSADEAFGEHRSAAVQPVFDAHRADAADAFDDDVFDEMIAALAADGTEQLDSPNAQVGAFDERSLNTRTMDIDRSADTDEVFDAQRSVDTSEVFDAQQEAPAEQPPEVFDGHPEPVDGQRSANTGRPFAEQVRDAANSRADVDSVEQVLALTDAGESRRAVAQAVGMSPSTVSGLVKAAAELREVDA